MKVLIKIILYIVSIVLALIFISKFVLHLGVMGINLVYTLGILFTGIFSIGILMRVIISIIKEKNYTKREKIIQIFMAILFFSLMSLFFYFVCINRDFKKAILTFCITLLLFSIISIFTSNKNRSLFTLISLISILTILQNTINLSTNILLYVIGFLIYLIPIFAYYCEKSNFKDRVNKCNKEIEAKIIKIYKSKKGMSNIYIPKLEVILDGKKNKIIDSNEIFSYDKDMFKINENIKLMINPNTNKITPKNVNENVILPYCCIQNIKEQKQGIFLFYFISFICFLLIVFLRIYC